MQAFNINKPYHNQEDIIKKEPDTLIAPGSLKPISNQTEYPKLTISFQTGKIHRFTFVIQTDTQQADCKPHPEIAARDV